MSQKSRLHRVAFPSVTRCTCVVITGGHRVQTTAVCPVHGTSIPVPSTSVGSSRLVVTDNGFTANVIEGDDY